MKILSILCLLLLSACGRWGDHYQPPLASEPKNMAKYEQDRKACIAQTKTTQAQRANAPQKDFGGRLKDSTAAAIPIIGAGMVLADYNDPSYVDNTPMGMTDRCMAAKGYNVIIEKHCC